MWVWERIEKKKARKIERERERQREWDGSDAHLGELPKSVGSKNNLYKAFRETLSQFTVMWIHLI